MAVALVQAVAEGCDDQDAACEGVAAAGRCEGATHARCPRECGLCVEGGGFSRYVEGVRAATLAHEVVTAS